MRALWSLPLGLALLACPAEANDWRRLINIPLPTLGGKQVWADLRIAGGWRIQQNAITGRHRLLDPKNIRRAWGDMDACQAALDKARKAGKVRQYDKSLVLLVHGIARSTGTFSEMAPRLRSTGLDAQAISYPSTRRNISQHADQLETILENLAGVQMISFVTHSMGGLVVRELLSRSGKWRNSMNVGRVVLIAPPNQGSAIARILKDFAPYKWLYGPAGQQLTPEGAAVIPGLDGIDFGVIAGGRGTTEGYSPLVPGDDDGTVGVSETNLSGASDRHLVNARHVGISNNPATIAATIKFLKNRRFN